MNGAYGSYCNDAHFICVQKLSPFEQHTFGGWRGTQPTSGGFAGRLIASGRADIANERSARRRPEAAT